MKEFTTYLNFEGKTREAMKFYEKCFGGKLQIMTFGEARVPDLPTEAADRVMHARLSKGALTLMASDTMPGMPYKQGNNFGIAVACESRQEAERLFGDLGDKGQVTMPLAKTFWAERFGMVTDRYGIGWMLTFQGSAVDPFAAK